MLKKISAYTWFAVAAVLLYSAYVVGSRYLENREIERRQLAVEAERYKPYAGKGTSVRIVQFYAPQTVARGEAVSICYSVENAKTVRIEPPVEKLWPSLSRCISTTPREDTTYTLTAEGNDGSAATQSIKVVVSSN
jgi:hypothetical protein